MYVINLLVQGLQKTTQLPVVSRPMYYTSVTTSRTPCNMNCNPLKILNLKAEGETVVKEIKAGSEEQKR